MNEPIITYRGPYAVVSNTKDPTRFSYTYAMYPNNEGMYYADYKYQNGWEIVGMYDTIEEAKQAATTAWQLGLSDDHYNDTP